MSQPPSLFDDDKVPTSSTSSPPRAVMLQGDRAPTITSSTIKQTAAQFLAADPTPIDLPQLVPIVEQQKHQQTPIFSNAASDLDYLTKFEELSKKGEESYKRMRWSIEQITSTQQSRDQELLAYKETVDRMLDNQRRSLDDARKTIVKYTSTEEELRRLVASQAERIASLEQELHATRHETARLVQTSTHAESSAKIAETGRCVAEVRQKELEVALEYTMQFSGALRNQLALADQHKAEALDAQLKNFEQCRQGIIAVYDSREHELIRQLNETIEAVYAKAQDECKKREEVIVRRWDDIMGRYKAQYDNLQAVVGQAQANVAGERARLLAEVARGKDALVEQHKLEMDTITDRCRRTEEDLLRHVAAKEKELRDREERLRVERAEVEQSTRAAVLSKENEMRSAQEAAVNRAVESFERERLRLVDSFTEQLQKMSNMHLNNVRELEHFHREKERDLLQRCKTAELTTNASSVAAVNPVEMDVGRRAQEALLTKFESIESRQKERAEMIKNTLRGERPDYGEQKY